MAEDCGNASAAMEENALAVQLLSGVVNYLDKIYKERSEANGTVEY